MTDPTKIEKSSDEKSKPSRKEQKTNPVKLISTNKSPKESKIEVFKNKRQATKTPYRHTNYNRQCIIQQTNHRRNQYEKVSEDPSISKKSSSVEFYHFPNQISRYHIMLQKIKLGWPDPFTTQQLCSIHRKVISSNILNHDQLKNEEA